MNNTQKRPEHQGGRKKGGHVGGTQKWVCYKVQEATASLQWKAGGQRQKSPELALINPLNTFTGWKTRIATWRHRYSPPTGMNNLQCKNHSTAKRGTTSHHRGPAAKKGTQCQKRTGKKGRVPSTKWSTASLNSPPKLFNSSNRGALMLLQMTVKGQVQYKQAS